MEEERQQVRLAVYIIFRNDVGKILFIRRHNTGWKDGEYTLPAGHVDPGETAISACIHEALEEVCLKIKPENLKLINTTQYQKTSSKSYNYINLFFECSDFNGNPKIGEPEKCDDLIWLSIDQFNTISIIDSVRFSLESALNNIPFSTFGFDQ